MNSKKTPRTMLRILVKEDISIYRSGICESIEETFPDVYCHAISNDVQLATETLQQPWDIIVVGTMSFQETFLAITCVKKIAPHVPLIIFEDEPAKENIEKVSKLGVNVYMGKNSRIEDIVASFQQVAATIK